MLIDMQRVSKTYEVGDVTVPALVDATLQIQCGEDVAIVGPSGSGKSTLLNLLGCLDVPTGGHYWFDGHDVGSFSRNQLAKLRNQRIGFIFQSFNLLPRLTAQQNVELPLIYAGCSTLERSARSLELLRMLGLADRTNHFPNQLSGGQQQRVAIARALVNRPQLLLADEPTGALDAATGRVILDLLKAIHKAGTTLAIITHDLSVASRMSRTIRLMDGSVHPAASFVHQKGC